MCRCGDSAYLRHGEERLGFFHGGVRGGFVGSEERDDRVGVPDFWGYRQRLSFCVALAVRAGIGTAWDRRAAALLAFANLSEQIHFSDFRGVSSRRQRARRAARRLERGHRSERRKLAADIQAVVKSAGAVLRR